MAAELGLSRGLVLECYSQLQAEGFLTSQTGSATRVASGALTPSTLPVKPAPPPRLAVDFRPGVPDLTSFPRREWAWALRESCRNATPAELGYGDPRGTEALRQMLAGYLRRVRATVADAEQIVICIGFAQGVNLVLRSLADAGVRRVAIEDPGDNDYHAISSRLGIEAVPVPIDERGIDCHRALPPSCWSRSLPRPGWRHRRSRRAFARCCRRSSPTPADCQPCSHSSRQCSS
jgi:GntR family transcriptional regulator/MocR family aminotransferase